MSLWPVGAPTIVPTSWSSGWGGHRTLGSASHPALPRSLPPALGQHRLLQASACSRGLMTGFLNNLSSGRDLGEEGDNMFQGETQSVPKLGEWESRVD